MAFKFSKNVTSVPENPEALFLDFRARRVKGLIAHQADVLRSYMEKGVEQSDVAFQLPTGSGKTLVGLLMGEWRRQKFNERVVYLCPTKQLVHQVVEQARADYGMKVNGFVGKHSDYPQNTKAEYLSNEAIAITTYSGLFNTNPFFSDPQTIILDDAHSAENYIASQWSVRIERYSSEQENLFKEVVALFKHILSPVDYQKLTGNEQSLWDKTWVEKIPTLHFYPLIPRLVEIIDAAADQLDLRFPWSLIRDRLTACHLYLGSNEILLRPLLPPSNTHLPFSNAKQRIYMSATLGEGGELERLTGRKKILRLPVSGNWENQGIGRRFFFFPEMSLQTGETEDLVFEMIKQTGRALVIAPDEATAMRFRQNVTDKLSFPTFGAREIEQSKAAFVTAPQAVAVVANRYDGIDFPNDECRLLIIENIARATNLQESFFVTRAGAVALLNDRILTRLQQAFGRCTRATTDYAAITILGGELFAYLLKPEKREFFHPELQAELKFGIEQSKNSTASGFLENLQLFLSQGEDWEQADNEIIDLRRKSTQKKLPAVAELQTIVKYEVEYQYAVWAEDYEKALEQCRKVLTGIQSPDLRGYRALWLYLAGSAAWLAHQAKAANMLSTAQEYFKAAADALQGGSLLSRIGRIKVEGAVESNENSEIETMILVERLESVLSNRGMIHDANYDRQEKFILDTVMENDAVKFEAAQVHLGELLGFDAGNRETNGAPDPWWIVDENLCFIFEDHSNAKDTSSLHVDKARQAATHPNWARANLPLNENAEIISILVTPVKKADKDALPHLENVYLWNLEEFRSWAKNALKAVRELRRSFGDAGDLDWREKAVQKYVEATISPKSLREMLLSQPANKQLLE